MTVAQVSAKASTQRTIYMSSTNYTTAHHSTTGILSDLTDDCVGQGKVGSTYYIFRNFNTFDISSAEIPANALIQSVKLRLGYVYNPSGFTHPFQIIIKKGVTSDYPHYPLVVGDYHYLKYTDNGGSIETKDIPDTGIIHSEFYIPFSTTGVSWINISDTDFGIVLFSSRDINEDIPDGSGEQVSILLNQDYFPRLDITYFLPTGPPTVISTGPCTDRQATTMTAVGNVTNAGGGYTDRGFEFYEDGFYDSEMYAVREKGVFTETGNYYMTIYGLKPLTVYHIRAWIQNIFGISYGEWYLCTTTTLQTATYDVYTEPNTAKYRLYVSDDEAIAWRGYKGPYSGKQTLINISDITNKTKGVKVLKVDLPDANTKGNFHICITVKQTLKG